MATRNVELKGPIRWARVFKENRDMHGFEGAYEDHGGAYTIEIGLDDAQFKELKASGSMKKGREGDDGLTWVKFTRKHQDRFEWASGEPKVVNNAGDAWDMEMDGEIGNDSEAIVSLSVYDTSRPSIKGTRLEKVQVVRLVPKETKTEDRIPF